MVKTYFFLLKYFFVSLKYGAFASILWISACSRSQQNNENKIGSATISADSPSAISHAVGFNIESLESFKVLHFFRHYNDIIDTISFTLRKQNAAADSRGNGINEIQLPLKKIALLHSSYLAYFDILEATDRLLAISESKYIYDSTTYKAISQGVIYEVGFGETLDKEKLLALGISAVVTVGWPNTPNKSQQMLEELGIPVLILSEWQETTLLGRLEWIKVIGALTGKEVLADSLFSSIAERYDSLKYLTKSIEQKPDVICNLPYKGSWYMPGGNSYISNVIQDAGANYLWADDNGTGGIQIDFEVVYSKGTMADFWINPGNAGSVKDIVGQDERLQDFKAIKAGKVYNSNKRVSREMANDYWESGIVRPDLILADLIKVFHPELLTDHDYFYYKNLK